VCLTLLPSRLHVRCFAVQPPELLRYGRMSPAVDVYAFGVMSECSAAAANHARELGCVQCLQHEVVQHHSFQAVSRFMESTCPNWWSKLFMIVASV
jgi:hypothetical protein